MHTWGGVWGLPRGLLPGRSVRSHTVHGPWAVGASRAASQPTMDPVMHPRYGCIKRGASQHHRSISGVHRSITGVSGVHHRVLHWHARCIRVASQSPSLACQVCISCASDVHLGASWGYQGCNISGMYRRCIGSALGVHGNYNYIAGASGVYQGCIRGASGVRYIMDVSLRIMGA